MGVEEDRCRLERGPTEDIGPLQSFDDEIQPWCYWGKAGIWFVRWRLQYEGGRQMVAWATGIAFAL
jgi:hypothetical protein